MVRYIIRRMLWVVVVILMITLFAFLVFYVMPPGDPAVSFAGRRPTADTLEQVRENLGLDKPTYVQYGLFVKQLFLGDEYGWPGFGFSFASQVSVRDQLFNRVGVTLQLAVGAVIVWLAIGIPIGVLSALKRRSKADRLAMGFALFGVSTPVFWLGLMGLFVFWYKLGWAPGTGYIPFGESPFQWFTHMLMPWFVVALLFAAFYARMVRGNMIEVMSEDYIRTARAKGLPERTVVVKHGLRAGLTPIVTMVGLDFAQLIGGAIVTERVFNLPGLGNATVDAVNRGDLPVVLGVTVFAALAITIMNLLVDIAYAYLDPRVRYT
ncbi:MAG TPA: ABC transporter permease [Actinomycetota bacterium]|nr:ABC transporter permease [Actinomycetota bacterium]